ncbi:hypothetical protein SUGI_0135930 [Cryptomeria japonica]|uniref:protein DETOXIFICATION 54 isoform X1 n=2 Tax=Cryptomeria japonica TaxID=3369 RepID=UPI002408E8A1|nr:protein DETOXIFICATION 54 isoform X1 [Cryptomeria japonica]GLJ10825.1 hypothetical protein SUGI_0135930 [Cryptomeria japonica]
MEPSEKRGIEDGLLHKLPTFSEVMEELKELSSIGMPVTAMNFVVYLRAMVSVLCMGRLGSLELAGGALAIGFTNITGYSVLFGLASGMDPVCGQAYGSQNWSLIGLSLHRTILMLLSASVPISLVWINLESIMLRLRQDPKITEVASVYCLFAVPDLLANSILQPLRVYLRSQGITRPMMWSSFFAVVFHVPLTVLLVFVFNMGVPGVAIATWCTNFNMVLFLVAYLLYTGVHKRTYVQWSLACLREWCPLLKLALPSCFAVCLEWWWYEIMTLLAGYLNNPEVTVATAAIVIQTTSLMYTVPMALGSSVSTRVGNELGAFKPSRAKLATFVALGCAVFIALVSVTWTTFLRYLWGRVFTKDAGVLALTGSVLPIIGLCELGNCPQTTGCGVLRGSARPAIGARINLWSFYLIGMPVAIVLAFFFKLGLLGLCYGLLAAQIACAFSILLVVLRTDWASEACKARELTGGKTELELSNSSDEELGLLNDASKELQQTIINKDGGI